MSAIDRELKVLRGFCSCAGDMAAVDEAEAEVAAFRARTDAQAQEIADLRARLADVEGALEWLCRNRMNYIDGEAFSHADTADQFLAWIKAARGGA